MLNDKVCSIQNVKQIDFENTTKQGKKAQKNNKGTKQNNNKKQKQKKNNRHEKIFYTCPDFDIRMNGKHLKDSASVILYFEIYTPLINKCKQTKCLEKYLN